MSQATVRSEGFTVLQDEEVYCIPDAHQLPPFLMNVVSSCDAWMFLTSTGGLTAGRCDANGAYFPYETVDKLYHAHHVSGPVTWLRCGDQLWQPFDPASGNPRALYKNLLGNQVTFEETHPTLALRARYRWAACDAFGLVRTVTVQNESPTDLEIEILDGFRNIQPWGITASMYNHASCLTDAYKRNELDSDHGLALYYLSAGIVDDAHPAEILRGNVAWIAGLDHWQYSIEENAVQSFQRNASWEPQAEITGRRGHFFARTKSLVPAGETIRWHIVGDVGLSHAQLVQLQYEIANNSAQALFEKVESEIDKATAKLEALIAQADARQVTQLRSVTANHRANVLFNCMRGGIFADHYRLSAADLAAFIRHRNVETAQQHQALLDSLKDGCDVQNLKAVARSQASPDLVRLCHEYLPLIFSRRHGDPSRPWNRFSIHLNNDEGQPRFHYEGNWRDIFQNWESLCVSYPHFLESIIAKFVNGTTVDGFNPYRVTNDGLEWEEPDPEDPWANIGYWGDHQIAYLLKLLESLTQHDPKALKKLFDEEIFSYFQIPYRLRQYRELTKNARDTIQYDWKLSKILSQRTSQMGDDGKLIQDEKGVYHVNLIEKLLVPMLSKLSNFVPDGGIWMNTQRPEWNDANNALVGNGLSMVTLCYLRRYMHFLSGQLEPGGRFRVSREVAHWLRQILSILENHAGLLDRPEIKATERRQIVDDLGQAFCDYRTLVYDHGFSSRDELQADEIARLCQLAIQFADMSIQRNQRDDGLYHSYNLIRWQPEGIEVGHLYEMLEGQVAVLSAGTLSADEAKTLCQKIFDSNFYRQDQDSFMLYPARPRPEFMQRNVVPEQAIQQNPLLAACVQNENTSLVELDALGVYRFHATFQRAGDVRAALQRLAKDIAWQQLVADCGEDVVALFEQVFQHKSYTGRSGSMYGYEGIGCIYWHMVSKLAVAIQENTWRAIDQNEPDETVSALAHYYYRVCDGLGRSKSAAQYGAFPMDPYSHTPGHAGAQQPGMTGQVKEGILARFAELGIAVRDGRLKFCNALLRRSEFLDQPQPFRYLDAAGNWHEFPLQAGQLAFTFCQIPVVYTLESDSPSASVQTTFSDGRTQVFEQPQLDRETTQAIIGRTRKVARLDVSLAAADFNRNR